MENAKHTTGITYQVQYQLGARGIRHRALKAAVHDYLRCLSAARRGGDVQGITLAGLDEDGQYMASLDDEIDAAISSARYAGPDETNKN